MARKSNKTAHVLNLLSGGEPEKEVQQRRRLKLRLRKKNRSRRRPKLLPLRLRRLQSPRRPHRRFLLIFRLLTTERKKPTP